MRLSTRARYALRMMLDIARRGEQGDPVALASVAERTDLSPGYLEQVATALRNARLLRAVSGRRGGYRLASPPADITIRQVLEAAIGPICLVDCIDEPDACVRSEYCECRVVYVLINRGIAEVLQSYTLADLLDPSWVRARGGAQALISGTVESFDGAGCNPAPRRGGRKGQSN